MSFGDDTLDPVRTFSEDQIRKGIELAQQWYEGHVFDEMDPKQIIEAIEKSS